MKEDTVVRSSSGEGKQLRLSDEPPHIISPYYCRRLFARPLGGLGSLLGRSGSYFIFGDVVYLCQFGVAAAARRTTCIDLIHSRVRSTHRTICAQLAIVFRRYDKVKSPIVRLMLMLLYPFRERIEDFV